MNTSDITLLKHWQSRRDAKAFQELVSRHSGMVFSTCQRILRNVAEAEEVAQECFMALAQAEIKKIRILGGWLHSAATSRSLDRLRSNTRRGIRDQQYSVAIPSHVEPTWDDIQSFVDEAIDTLPADLSTVVIEYFLEGRKQTEIAISLEVSPSAVSRRIDRAVGKIREQLKQKGIGVGLALLPTLLSEAKAEATPKTLTAALGKLALSGGETATPASISHTIGKSLSSFGAKSGIAALVIIGIAVVASLMLDKPGIESPATPIVTADVASAIESAPNVPIPAPPVLLAENLDSIEPESDSLPPTASMTGVVVFKDNGEPAEGMKVMLGTMATDSIPRSIVTGSNGNFEFKGIKAGESAIVAHDNRFDEFPEDWDRSEDLELTFAQGETKEGIRIEVPSSRGGQVSGLILDKQTMLPLAGVPVEAGKIGREVREGRSNAQGKYIIWGLEKGIWKLRPDQLRGNIAVGGRPEDFQDVYIDPETPQNVDILIERGTRLRGQVVDIEGNPVPKARINVLVVPANKPTHARCNFKADKLGKFTIWGAKPGDRVVIDASRKDEKSFINVINPVTEQPVDNILLTFVPSTPLSGQFIDENGLLAEANIWYRPVHPNGNGIWSGQAKEADKDFQIDLPPGSYEIKGRNENVNFSAQQAVQILISTAAISDIHLPIITHNERIGQYSLTGVLINEQSHPLKNRRVYISESSGESAGIFKETYTDSKGRFSFDGLLNSYYRVHATLYNPYEKYAGFDHINPAENPDIEIVGRIAAKLEGNVWDAKTSLPISKITIEYGEINSWGTESRWEQFTIVSKAGQFEVRARLDEDWYLRIGADGYAPKVIYGDALASGEVVDDLEFKLSAGFVVNGRVRNEKGEAINDAFVYYTTDVFQFNDQLSATQSDTSGAFTIQSLPDDAEWIYVKKEGFATAQVSIEESVNIALTEGGIIEGRLLIGGVVPPENTRILAMDSQNPLSYYWSQTDVDGFYRIPFLMNRAYKLNIMSRDESGQLGATYDYEEPVHAEDGMVTTINLSVPLGNSVLEGSLLQDGVPVGTYPLGSVNNFL